MYIISQVCVIVIAVLQYNLCYENFGKWKSSNLKARINY